MLTPMDDTLWHQLPTTFDHVGTSDPRFFDRFWFAASDPAGQGTLQLTLGAYNNMNVMDGGFVAIRSGRQHNLRVSRSLRPRFETACGPIRVEVVEPLHHARLLVEDGAHGMAAELDWKSILPAQEEIPRFTRVRGRVVEESRRFDQIGELSGWIRLAGERVELDRWWATRDHSWGVRERMGIEEPVTGPPAPPSAGSLFAFLFFSTGGYGGHLQVAQHEGRPDYFTCELTRRDDPQADPVELHLPDRAPIAITFSDDRSPRRFRTARFSGRLADGSAVEIETTALGCAVDMQGLGYGGYDDARGLGVWRGDSHLEHDVWDVSHPSDVVRASGTVRPIHRIQPVRVVMRGGGLDGEGTGSLTLIAEGRLPQLGLG
ncbi:MAG: hypothetical protein H6748_12655 [Spirochaetaceae bacterium]|nr:hypothetical protein [Myxococcales bacterium]MCB9724892.1 hypothetical protein [Spirochaetaceae bacterium]